MKDEEYSDEELQDLPQTTTVLNTPSLNMQSHTWLQSGNKLIDQCCDGREVTIPYGKMLIKQDGFYDLIDE